MTGKLEKDIQSDVTDHADKILGLVCLRLNVVGRKGWPDYGYGHGGYLCFVEYKKPGEKPEPLQEYVHAALRGAGFHVFVVENADYGKALLEEWKNYVDHQLETIRESNDRDARLGSHLRLLVRSKKGVGK